MFGLCKLIMFLVSCIIGMIDTKIFGSENSSFNIIVFHLKKDFSLV